MKIDIIRTIAVLLVVLSAAAFAKPPYSEEGTGWRTDRLDLDISVIPANKKIRVKGSMTLELEADASYGPSIVLNSNKTLLRFSEVSARGASSVKLNQPIPTRDATIAAHLRFQKQFKKGDRVEVSFEYESEGAASQFGVTDQAAIASWVEAWHPVPLFDPEQTSLSAAAKSRGTFTIHMPAEWRGAAEGVLKNRTVNGTNAVEEWVADDPVARSFAAGEFRYAEKKVGSRDVAVYRLGEAGVSAEKLAGVVGDILAALEKRFGPYPYDSYRIIEVPEDLGEFGAASLQGMILAKAFAFKNEDGSIPLFAHEMSHGWWGNLVGTRGPGGILCSESLAQYGALVAIEALEGDKAGTDFMRFSRKDYIEVQSAKGYFGLVRGGQDIRLSELTSGGVSHTLSDSKGHWIYLMLRRRVGDKIFFATLRKLIAEFANRQMSLDDVRSAFEKAAPNKGLGRFFSQWLDQTGAPVISLEKTSDEKGKHIVTVKQLQDGEPYDLTLDLGLRFRDGSHSVQTVDLTSKEQTFTIEGAEDPVEITADPMNRLLIWTPEYGPNPVELAALRESLTEEEMQKYTGDYEVPGMGTLRVLVRDGKLFGRLLPGTHEREMVFEGDNKFNANGTIITFTVVHGRAIELSLLVGNQKRVGKRVS